jgi:hypothetical protein
MKRRHIGIDLKGSYWNQAVANCEAAEPESENPTLFDLM